MKKLILLVVMLFIFSLSSCTMDSFLNPTEDKTDVVIYQGEYVLKTGEECTFDNVKFTSKSFQYNGYVHSLEVENAPSNATVTYTNNSHKEIGEYKVTAVVTAPGYVTKTMEAVLTVYGPFTPGVLGAIQYDALSDAYLEVTECTFNELQYERSKEAIMNKIKENVYDEEGMDELFEQFEETLVTLYKTYFRYNYQYYANGTEENYKSYSVYNEMLNSYNTWYYEMMSAARDSVYKEYIFEGLTEDEIEEYLQSVYSDEKVEGYKNTLKDYNNNGQNYFNTLSDADLFNACVDNLMDIVETGTEYAKYMGKNNYLEIAFETYDKTYTVEEVAEFCTYARTYIPTIMNSVLNELNIIARQFTSMNQINYYYQIDSRDYNYRNGLTNDLTLCDNFMYLMGDDMESLYEHFWTDGLYVFSSSENCMGTASSSRRYSFLNDDCILFFGEGNQSLTTFVHEFGHYYHFIYGNYNYSLDLDELNSEGLVALLMAYITNTYANSAESCAIPYMYETTYWLLNELYYVAVCAQTAEVEVWAHTHPEATREELVQQIYTILSGYGSYYDLTYWGYGTNCSIGYYSSYATSMVSVVELYCLAREDFNAAKCAYLKLNEFNPTYEVKDADALKYIGLHSFLDEDAFKYIYSALVGE